jgi:hypothetical protein
MPERSAGPGTGAVPSGRVLVLGQFDGFANGLKPTEVARFLVARGHRVQLVDTYFLSRAANDGTLRHLPGVSPSQVALFCVERGISTVSRLGAVARRRLSYPLLRAELRLRRGLLRRRLPLHDFDLVICETPQDAPVLLECAAATTYYDCPTPWADELFLEGRLTAGQHRRLRRFEASMFEAVDHLSFHWESYARYAVEHYGISGHNLSSLNFGCHPSPHRATFRGEPRIVYMGSLSSRFIDLQLLSRLSLVAKIDVYGGPRPDPALGLSYCGWAPPDVLADYQFGLVTCTKDDLRRQGFSAKHLQYFAHGLPVLVPRWRQDCALAAGSIPYDEESFLSAIAEASVAEAWQALSNAAYAQAKRYSWDRTLAPLEDLLLGISKAAPG